jgi:hypothetical protein
MLRDSAISDQQAKGKPTMTRTQELDDILGDIFDIRDVIARYEELEAEREALVDALDEASQTTNDEAETDMGSESHQVASEAETEAKEALDEWDEGTEGEEFAKIKSFLNDVKGYGGDEQWRGDWYPVTFIADSYFTDYAEELVKDIGDMPRDIPHYIVIDWEATAHNIRQDYSSVDIDGQEYWYR